MKLGRARRLSYLAPGDLLKGRVEPILWMRSCQWLAAAGLDVTVIWAYAYRGENIPLRSLFGHFGVPETFDHSMLPTPLVAGRGPRSWTRAWLFLGFLLRLAPQFLGRRLPVYFSKGQICMRAVLALERMTGRRAFKTFELHSIGSDRRLEAMLRRMDLVVANSRLLAGRLERLGVEPDRIVQVYNAPFAEPQEWDRDDARRELGIAIDANVLTYSGKLTSTNLPFLIATARRLVSTAEVHVVGGNPDVLVEARREGGSLGNLHFHGFVAPARLGAYLSASDALFCSYPDRQVNIEQATPAKYFDYMLAGRPVLCSRNTAITEIWEHERNCLFFTAEDADDLVGNFERLLASPELGERLVGANRKLIERLSWERRMGAIVERMAELGAFGGAQEGGE